MSEGKKSVSEAYSIPRTTLRRYLKKVEEEFKDIESVNDEDLLKFVRACSERVPSNQVFSTAEEKDLMEYILECANHYSHLSIEALDLAVENGVHILSFPPHCSHRLQPLDVSVFSPVKTSYKSQCAAWQKSHANRTLDIRHLPGLICKSLDLAMSPKIIKSGFQAKGIMPFNPDIFGEADYVEGVEHDADNQQLLDEQPSTSSSSRTSMLNKVGLLQADVPKQKTNRGSKPMQSSVLTSPEILNNLKKKVEERVKKTTAAFKRAKLAPAKMSAKRSKFMQSPESDEDADFCIICCAELPLKLFANNSVHCIGCNRPVHLRCVKAGEAEWKCEHCLKPN